MSTVFVLPLGVGPDRSADWAAPGRQQHALHHRLFATCEHDVGQRHLAVWQCFHGKAFQWVWHAADVAVRRSGLWDGEICQSLATPCPGSNQLFVTSGRLGNWGVGSRVVKQGVRGWTTIMFVRWTCCTPAACREEGVEWLRPQRCNEPSRAQTHSTRCTRGER